MNRLIESLGNKVVFHKWLYYTLNLTWGLFMTLLGYILLILLLPFGKVKIYNYTLYLKIKPKSKTNGGWGFSVGMVFFVYSSGQSESLLSHEFGHTVQNAILGPFMLFLVSIPSVIRFWYREVFYYKKGKLPLTKYDSIWFENTASNIGYAYVIGRTQYSKKYYK